MSKKMLLLSVPLALLLTACNGNDRKPTAGLPNNPSPTQPGNPTPANPGTTVTATVNNDDLDRAIDNGQNIAANSAAALSGSATFGGTGGPTGSNAIAGTQTVALQILPAPAGDDENDNLQAKLSVNGTTYTLRETGDGTDEFNNSSDTDTDTFVTARLLGASEQSGFVRYDVRTSTESDDEETTTVSGTTGYASFGALTPENRIPTRSRAEYNGNTVLSVAATDGIGGERFVGDARVLANFDASASDRFNGTTFTYGTSNAGSDGGTLTARDGSSAHTGNAFSAGLTPAASQAPSARAVPAR